MVKVVSRRKRTTRKKVTLASIAKNKKACVKIIKTAAEKKHNDVSISATAATAAGTLNTTLNTIIRGTSDYRERVGDQITPKSLQIRFRAYSQGAAIDRSNFVRLIVFQWYDTVVTPVVADVLDNTTSVLSTENAPNAFYNWNNKLKFRVLYDKTLQVSSEGPSTARHTRMVTKGFRPIRYAGALATDLTSNGIYILYISDSTTVDHPFVNIHMRMNYVDA